ncbi:MAG: sigma-54-dependent Fis family transcriptional regulator [Gammaproteobacteria bacterium]|nr:sigma-54-dependent Fis family transcriptional regulator [Gammaproteobacteria bacterium]
MNENLPQIIFIDDDKFIRKSTTQSLEMADFEVTSYSRADSALKEIDNDCAKVIVSDIKMPGLSGLELLQRVKDIDTGIPVILITGQGDIATAVQAMRDGAYDFLEKPFSAENLIEVIRRAYDKRMLILENRHLKTELELQNIPGQRLIGKAPAIQQLRTQISRLANTDTDILLWGETGTGKDLVARNLHEVSKRSKAPFVAINCGALPENIIESELFGHAAGAFTGASKTRIGKFEYANGGTVFLDEIESMPLDLQVKLLRVLHDRVVEPLGSNKQIDIDIRVIAATKIDLKQASDQGLFREDLYYRLNVITLTLPTLRNRVEDIPLLFHHYALIAAARHECDIAEIDPEQLQQLLVYPWPGNVRELKNAAERFVLLGDTTEQNLGEVIHSGDNSDTVNLHDRVEWFEKSLIEQALEKCQGSITETLTMLATPRKTLYDKMQKYGIDKGNFKSTD